MADGATPTGRTLADYGYRHVAIELDNRCNMACAFCPYPLRHEDHVALSLDDMRSILDQCVALAPDKVWFNLFNEPLLYPHLWECLDMATERGLAVAVPTNGLLLTDDNVQRFLDHPPHEIRISLQVVMEHLHNAARGHHIDFDKYLQRLARAMAVFLDREHDVRVIEIDVAVGSQYQTRKQLMLALQGVTDPGDPSVSEQQPETLHPHLSWFLSLVDEASASFTFDSDLLARNLENAFRADGSNYALAYRLGERMVIRLKEFHTGRKIAAFHPVTHGSCDTMFLGIRATGAVVPCCLDYEGAIKLGDVHAEPILDILERNRTFLDKLRQPGPLPHPACRRCKGAPTLHGAPMLDALGRKLMRP